MADITILGSGGFGLALAIMCDNAGHKVTVWSKFQDEIDAIKRTGELKAKLPGVQVNKTIELTTDISCVKDKDMVILGIPSPFLREVCESVVPYLESRTIVVNTAKGLEGGSLKTMCCVARECFPNNHVAVLTGPSHAEEVARNIPTVVVVGAKKFKVALKVQNLFANKVFRTYISPDRKSIELGGSLKNVIALAAGIIDGLGFGDNTEAALITRGIKEITQLGVEMGGNAKTFYGLSGIGDLIVTCNSKHSRNRRAGVLIGKGYTLDEAVKEVKMVVEGAVSAKAALELARKYNVSVPIIEAVNQVLFEGKTAIDGMWELMEREQTNEYRDLQWDE